MSDPYPYSNISHSPMMGLTHPINQHFKLVQKIHTSEQTVQPETHIVWSSNIKTQIRPYKRHQPQNSYSKSVLTYPKQFCLHTIEYYSISQESHIQSILTITCILNHLKSSFEWDDPNKWIQATNANQNLLFLLPLYQLDPN